MTEAGKAVGSAAIAELQGIEVMQVLGQRQPTKVNVMVQIPGSSSRNRSWFDEVMEEGKGGRSAEGRRR